MSHKSHTFFIIGTAGSLLFIFLFLIISPLRLKGHYSSFIIGTVGNKLISLLLKQYYLLLLP